MRRLHVVRLEYLRVIESHKSGYPHIHAIIQFPDARIRVENDRYFDKKLYSRWRLLWSHGHSDYQKPFRSGTGTLGYVLKYLIKNQTSRTIWKKILPTQTNVVSQDAPTMDSSSNNGQTTPLDSSVQNTILEKKTGELTLKNTMPTHLHGTKLATWSRGFDFTPFSMARRPESIVKGLKPTEN